MDELVRYIYPNPVRARMVKRAEQYEYSGHRAYIGRDSSRLVDVEPVLRQFGGTKRRALQVYERFVEAGIGQKSEVEYYRAAEGRLLGSEEFLEEITHRVGDHRAQTVSKPKPISIDELLEVAERISGIKRREFCNNSQEEKGDSYQGSSDSCRKKEWDSKQRSWRGRFR